MTTPRRASGFAILLFVAIFAAKAGFYALTLPIWEGFDEYAHFAVIQSLAVDGRYPVQGDFCSREIEASIAMLPMPRLTNIPKTTHDAYWMLADADRTARQRDFRNLDPSLQAVHGTELTSYENQQPPLYYWVSSVIYRPFVNAHLTTRVAVLRLLNVVFGCAALVVTYLLALRVADSSVAFWAVAFLAAMPQFAMTSARIANEPLAALLGGTALLMFLRADRLPQSALAGVAVAAALLTKAYMLSLVCGLVLYLGIEVLRRRTAIRHGGMTLLVATLLAGWWYLGNLATKGGITGEQNEAAVSASGGGIAGAIVDTDWARALDFMMLSHVWLGNWSFLVARSWMYRLVYVCFAIAAAGLILRYFRAKANSQTMLLLACYASFVGGLLYHAMLSGMNQGFPGTFGHYLDGMISSECILLSLGFAAWNSKWLRVGCVAALFLIELAGAHLYLLPYYAGLIHHNTAGKLPAYPVLQYGSPSDLFERLAVNGPAWVGAGLLEIAWGVFLLAMVSEMAIVLRDDGNC